MLYSIPTSVTTKPINTQAEIIRIAIRALHDPERDKEMIESAKTLLSEFFPTHGEYFVFKNEYYGIPEFHMDRLDPEEMQQEIYLSLVENLDHLSDDLLEMDDEAVVRMTKHYMGVFMDAASKRYVEKKNHISKYYATCVLHMYKYHNGMTIQGHTREEIANAVKDVYPNRPMTGYATAEKLIAWLNKQLVEQEVSTTEIDPAYEMDYDEGAEKALRLRRKIASLLTKDEQKVFDLMEDGMGEKEITEILKEKGITNIPVAKAIRVIRTAAIACMSQEQIAAHKKAQTFSVRMQKKEYRRLKTAAMAM